MRTDESVFIVFYSTPIVTITVPSFERHSKLSPFTTPLLLSLVVGRIATASLHDAVVSEGLDWRLSWRIRDFLRQGGFEGGEENDTSDSG